jgi:hypothetical protein
VAAGDLKNLKFFVNLYKEFVQLKKEDEILDSTFGLIDYIAQCKNFENYAYNVKKQCKFRTN